MKYECTKLSNLFCPLLSTRFVMSKYTDPDKAMNDEESKDDVLMQSDDLPIGIIDCVKVNKEYKDLIQLLEIAELENPVALEMIESKVMSYYSIDIIQNYRISQDLPIEDESKLQDNGLS